MALEILIPNSAIRNLIREDKIHQIYSMMQTGADKYGMQTLNHSLAALYRKRSITLEMALSIASNVAELKEIINQQGARPEQRQGENAPIRFQTPRTFQR
jgi:twitching motility protein PilT